MPAWGEQLVTVAEAAEYAGVTPATVRSWAHRGLLQAARSTRRGGARYRLDDVAEVERRTRGKGPTRKVNRVVA